MQEIIQKLVDMSNLLGSDAYDCAILGEGNTSARLDEECFLVKASGTQLKTIDAEGSVKVRFAPVIEALQQETLSDAEVKDALLQATVENPEQKMPSVETFLHAIILSSEGIRYAGHTHPTAVNSILCSKKAEEACLGSLFPDQIVVLGTDPLFVPYIDPGLVLAKEVQARLTGYVSRLGKAPRVIYMQNHGLIALGKSDKDILNITQMAVKTTKIIVGTYCWEVPISFLMRM